MLNVLCHKNYITVYSFFPLDLAWLVDRGYGYAKSHISQLSLELAVANKLTWGAIHDFMIMTHSSEGARNMSLSVTAISITHMHSGFAEAISRK